MRRLISFLSFDLDKDKQQADGGLVQCALTTATGVWIVVTLLFMFMVINFADKAVTRR
jgi:hypothetical protein